MNNPEAGGEFSLFMWALAAVVAVLGGHVFLGWVQQAQRRPALVNSWRAQLLAATTLGTAMTSTAVIGLAAEGLPYALGYGTVAGPVLWLGAMIGSLLIVFWLTHQPRWWALIGSGILMAAMAGAAQGGWIWAAGFRPGVVWDRTYLLLAALVMTVGFTAGLFVYRAERDEEGEGRRSWRVGGAVLCGLALMIGQLLVVVAADLATQKGSVYRYQIPSTLLSLACSVLMPLTLSVMALDLSLRRRLRQQRRSTFSPQKRRKRRHRVRTL